MNILNNFGFNPMLFVAQIVNFVIIYFILKKILYNPILDMLKKRDAEIKKGLVDAEEGHRTLDEAEQKEKQILQKAAEKAEKIVDEAKTQASEIKTQAEASTKGEIERMMTQAREQISQEEKIVEERLTKKIGEISLEILEKSLSGVFGKNEQKTIIKKATAALQKQL